VKKIITTVFAIALSLGVFAHDNDTMFIHMRESVLEIPVEKIDSIVFHRTQLTSFSLDASSFLPGTTSTRNYPEPYWASLQDEPRHILPATPIIRRCGVVNPRITGMRWIPGAPIVRDCRAMDPHIVGMKTGVPGTRCPDYWCPPGSTCFWLDEYGTVGCCPHEDANVCLDCLHCCPPGYVCDHGLRGFGGPICIPDDGDGGPPGGGNPDVPCVPGTHCPDYWCGPGQTCFCLDEYGTVGCCPHEDANVCLDCLTCCPPGYVCDHGLSGFGGAVCILDDGGALPPGGSGPGDPGGPSFCSFSLPSNGTHGSCDVFAREGNIVTQIKIRLAITSAGSFPPPFSEGAEGYIIHSGGRRTPWAISPGSTMTTVSLQLPATSRSVTVRGRRLFGFPDNDDPPLSRRRIYVEAL